MLSASNLIRLSSLALVLVASLQLATCENLNDLEREMFNHQNILKESKAALERLSKSEPLKLSSGQFDELFGTNLYKNLDCSQKRQNLLEDAISALKDEPLVGSYVERLYDWQRRHCKLLHGNFKWDKLVNLDKVTPEMMHELFGEKREPTEEEAIASKQVIEQLGNINSRQAEQLLTDSSKNSSLTYEAAHELLKKVGEKYNFQLGDTSDLLRIAEVKRGQCTFASMRIAYVLTLELGELNLPVANYVQNLGSEHFSECSHFADKGIEIFEAHYEPKTKEFLDLYFENVDEKRYLDFERSHDTHPEQFELIVDSLKKIAEKKLLPAGKELSKFRSSIGEPILEACKNLLFLRKKNTMLAEALLGKGPSSPSKVGFNKYLLCRAVPDNMFTSGRLQGLNGLSLGGLVELVIEGAFKKLEKANEQIVSEQRMLSGDSFDELPKRQVEVAFLKVAGDWLTTTIPKQTIERNIMRTTVESCEKLKMLNGFFWLAKAGYSLDLGDRFLRRILIEINTCNLLLNKTNTEELIAEWVNEESNNFTNTMRRFFKLSP